MNGFSLIFHQRDFSPTKLDLKKETFGVKIKNLSQKNQPRNSTKYSVQSCSTIETDLNQFFIPVVNVGFTLIKVVLWTLILAQQLSSSLIFITS